MHGNVTQETELLFDDVAEQLTADDRLPDLFNLALRDDIDWDAEGANALKFLAVLSEGERTPERNRAA
jgi:hypothetical protein